jgi:hypothetical protein
MKPFALAAIGLCLSAMATTAAAATICPTVLCIHAAPAPLIGAGLPVMLVVGGVWLGRKLWKRKFSTRASNP